jgi:hypothetical protein
MTYRNVVILEALTEDLNDGVFVLSFDDTGSGRKDAECGFTQARFGALACFEQNTEEFRPLFAYYDR